MQKKLYYCKDATHVYETVLSIWNDCRKAGILKIAFFGELGSGKTTFIRALCKIIGYKGSTDSPTFNIINEYMMNSSVSIYHLDLYRIEKTEELTETGVIEVLDNESDYVFIEWPDIISEHLADNFAKVYIKVLSKNERELTLKF